jgi:hypothetical protein
MQGCRDRFGRIGHSWTRFLPRCIQGPFSVHTSAHHLACGALPAERHHRCQHRREATRDIWLHDCCSPQAAPSTIHPPLPLTSLRAIARIIAPALCCSLSDAPPARYCRWMEPASIQPDDTTRDGDGTFAAPARPERNSVVPPYWQRHERHASRMSSYSSALGHRISLEDHTAEGSEQCRVLWAKGVTIDDYVVVSGSAPGLGAYVVWNCTVETLDVSLPRAACEVKPKRTQGPLGCRTCHFPAANRLQGC